MVERSAGYIHACIESIALVCMKTYFFDRVLEERVVEAHRPKHTSPSCAHWLCVTASKTKMGRATEVFRLVVQFELRMRMERMYNRPSYYSLVMTVTVTLAIFRELTCD